MVMFIMQSSIALLWRKGGGRGGHQSVIGHMPELLLSMRMRGHISQKKRMAPRVMYRSWLHTGTADLWQLAIAPIKSTFPGSAWYICIPYYSSLELYVACNRFSESGDRQWVKQSVHMCSDVPSFAFILIQWKEISVV
jgi:hypothetical protein